jgi:DNA-directed RNA polymerase subunit H (RpoH/RPB5)|tara:strand:- start:79 stop:441 length:363 start_codon:yes stop_codon:yes gene_type:complete
MTEELIPEFDPNDFAIRLRPHMVDGKWNGDVDICIMWDDKHKLTGEDFTKLMHLTKMICASVPMMEYDEALRSDISNYVIDYENDTLPKTHITEPVQAEVTSVDGNVIHLTFNTKTKGSA